MSFNDLAMELVSMIAGPLDTMSLLNLSLTCKGLRYALLARAYGKATRESGKDEGWYGYDIDSDVLRWAIKGNTAMHEDAAKRYLEASIDIDQYGQETYPKNLLKCPLVGDNGENMLLCNTTVEIHRTSPA
ncbi:hypothetical protein B0T17DRAFT_655821 [Bombardia bombarda]|uniref:F-box domain-containing protein n=1 Tax=Bombardia bombarda TaxID=252184 RepID=A0AA39WUK1_9PEZI|nr:hypothetical protein B0T17DRAFT_655821 [Bombardia bombarda]